MGSTGRNMCDHEIMTGPRTQEGLRVGPIAVPTSYLAHSLDYNENNAIQDHQCRFGLYISEKPRRVVAATRKLTFVLQG